MANESISQRPRAASVSKEDLLLISQKQTTGKYVTKSAKAESMMGKSAYITWVEQKTTINQFLEEVTAIYLQEHSNITNVSNFITVTNSQAHYNNWVTNNTTHHYGNITNYINNTSNLVEQYNTYISNNPITNITNNVQHMYSFLTSINHLNNYHQYIASLNIDTSQNTYLNYVSGDTIYNNYIQGTEIDLTGFIELFNLQDAYNQWVEDRLEDLDEREFIASLKGYDGTGSVLNKYTEVWVCASGAYIEKPSDPNGEPVDPDEIQLRKQFGLITFPEPTFIRMDRTHQIYSSNPDTVVSLTGMFKVLKANGSIEIISELLISRENNKAKFEPALNLDDTILIETGTTVNMSFKNTPNNLDTVSISLIARKVRSYSSSVNGLRIKGLWGINDSIFGDAVTNSGGMEYAEQIEHLFSNIFNRNNPFFEAYSVVRQSSGFESIISINNISTVRRILTLVPFQGSIYRPRGELVSDPLKLPANVNVLNNGNIEIILDGWED